MSGAVTRKSSKVSASATTSVPPSAGLGLPKTTTARCKTSQDSDDEDDKEEQDDEERGAGADTIDLIIDEKPDKSTFLVT
jgi:hypothetical protein